VRFVDLRRLSGPNVFGARPVIIARLELDQLTCKETTSFAGFAERLTMALPGLRAHHCAAGQPGGFLAAMAHGTYFGHVTEHVALELSGLAGREVHLGRTMWAGADGRYDVMMECPQDEPTGSGVPEELLKVAMRIIKDLLAKRRPDFSADLCQISRTVERERLGVSTAAIAAAARRRGIPVRRVAGLSLLRLGYGCNRRLVCAALTEQTSAMGVDIACDKVLARQLLAAAGIPVPDGVVVDSAQEAARALEALGAPVVIKPRSGNHGGGVTVGVSTAQQAALAYEQARFACPAVIVETFVPGTDYRVLVIGGKVVAAAELRPASVTGDGAHSISELIAVANADPRRGEGHSRELTRIVLDEAVVSHLAARGLDGHCVPASGEIIALRSDANLSTGGTSRDVTDRVHDDVAEMCRRAAAASGLDICGIDLRLADICAPMVQHSGALGGAPFGACAGAVIELNACPGLRMHLSPTEGASRDVAGAVVDRLYPPGTPSRIPLIAVTGTNGKTTTVRMIGHILRQAGLRVGMTTTDGVYSGGRLVYAADASGPRSAEMVLDDTTVQAAVLETDRGGIIRRGLGYDKADVAVITNISADHLGVDGVNDLEELVHVKALLAEEIQVGGTIVLNADDPATVALADRPAVRQAAPVIRYFSLRPGNLVVERHKKAGGISCEIRDGQLTEIEGGRHLALISVAELPGAFGGRAPHVLANALAAVAACRAVGVSAKDIGRALATFIPGEANPGRCDIYQAGRSPVVVDYGHNAAALEVTGRMISDVWGGEPVAAITLPGDRRDDLVIETAEAIAAWFGRVVVYEDRDRRGRRSGEMREIITTAMRRLRPDIVCEQAEDPEAALRTAVSLADGGTVLFLYEKLDMAHAALDAIGAQPWPAAAMIAHEDDASVPDDMAPTATLPAVTLPALTLAAALPAATVPAAALPALTLAATTDQRAAGGLSAGVLLAAVALPATGTLPAAEPVPATAQVAAASPLTRPDSLSQWNRGHW
jgi:cyanophycin synthetase